MEQLKAYVMSNPQLLFSFLVLHILVDPGKENCSGNNMTSFQLALQPLENNTGFCPRTASNCCDQTGCLDRDVPNCPKFSVVNNSHRKFLKAEQLFFLQKIFEKERSL